MSRTVILDSSLQYLTQAFAPKAAGAASSPQSYLDILKSLQGAQKADVDASPDDMTMEEYQSHIAEKLQSLAVDASRKQSSAAVIISDAGWARMKEDPLYESWVIGTVSADLAASDPWAAVGSGSYTIHRFGADPSAYSYDNWGKDYPGNIKGYLLSELFDFDITGNRSSSNNFWMKLAQKKLQSQNRQALLGLASGIASLQSLRISTALMQSAAYAAPEGAQK